MRKVQVSKARKDDAKGASFVSVPIVHRGAALHCLFFSRESRLAFVGVFDSKPQKAGLCGVCDSLIIPADVIHDARVQALDALGEHAPEVELEPPFAFAVDVVPVGTRAA